MGIANFMNVIDFFSVGDGCHWDALAMVATGMRSPIAI
jgi:hypothetical protein